MAFPTKTLAQLRDRVIANFRSAFSGYSMSTKKFFGRGARAIALLVWELHGAIEDLDKDIVPTAQSSDDALSEWAFTLGLPDGAGGFGRLKPVAATGGLATLTGVLGTAFTIGLTATSEDGVTKVSLGATVTIAGAPPGFGSVQGALSAVTPGAAGNLEVGTVLTWDSAPAGADATFALTSALAGGADTESNADVYARIVQRSQTPPTGGSAEDYRLWSDVSGVNAEYVYPKRAGTGTVDVAITQAGSGQGRLPPSAVIAAAQASIDKNRPVTVEAATAMAPYMPNGAGHLAKVLVTPSADKYAFDWDDTAGPYSVDTGGYSAGPPATIRLSGLAPASLKAAINVFKAAAGLAPRLQVVSTGSVINAAIRAVDFSDGGGKTTLTLEPVTAAWTAPSDADQVCAYGPVVETIAKGILALCDSLGPSRSSGLADAFTSWRDELTISGIVAVAQGAIDSDGAQLVDEIPVGDATIDGSVADVQASDVNAGAGPELLYLSHVVVQSA